MTGKELIMYILENDLLDSEVFSKEHYDSIFITPETAAFRWNTGTATVKAMIDMNKVKGFKYGETYLVSSKQPNPFFK